MLLISIVPGGWSFWGEWSECSKTCGYGGFQTRKRSCSNPIPQYNGASCFGSDTEAKNCSFDKPCCKFSWVFFSNILQWSYLIFFLSNQKLLKYQQALQTRCFRSCWSILTWRLEIKNLSLRKKLYILLVIKRISILWSSPLRCLAALMHHKNVSSTALRWFVS